MMATLKIDYPKMKTVALMQILDIKFPFTFEKIMKFLIVTSLQQQIYL